MRVNLLTDAPKHNLALMRISAYHKALGDSVILNEGLADCDISYGSWLFQQKYYTTFAGGPIKPLWDKRLDSKFEAMRPDYELFPIDFSLGHTWEYCPRRCGFCCVPHQRTPKTHHSIWDFHDTRFNKIGLLNNNTLCDPQWRETFEEIWDAKLTVLDQNGYDLRLLDEEKAEALVMTRFQGLIHFAWDCIKDERKILQGLRIAREFGLQNRSMVYVLTGFDTTIEEDIYRCQKIHDMDFDPFVMIYNNSRNRQLRQFRWLVNRTHAWRRSGFKALWETGYRKERRRYGRITEAGMEGL